VVSTSLFDRIASGNERFSKGFPGVTSTNLTPVRGAGMKPNTGNPPNTIPSLLSVSESTLETDAVNACLSEISYFATT
ncbi:MAG: hypothetical protein AAF986_07905, partial [Pseudomonadota bacterium]